MNKSLKNSLNETLKSEATYIMRTNEDISVKIDRMNEVINMQKIIENYDELEPILKKFFDEKALKGKWNNKER